MSAVFSPEYLGVLGDGLRRTGGFNTAAGVLANVRAPAPTGHPALCA
ncbi:MAG: hypothetical protein IPN17_25820 [Deltaproteobacteria bacterium]|nr:hypothetical protein [Deltaproteobacteria bacterium]